MLVFDKNAWELERLFNEPLKELMVPDTQEVSIVPV